MFPGGCRGRASVGALKNTKFGMYKRPTGTLQALDRASFEL
jgi:hypothetical protein